MQGIPSFAEHCSHVAALRDAALSAVDPAAAVREHFSENDFADARRVFLVGAGKAGAAMAREAASILGDRLTSGVVAVPDMPAGSLDRVRFIRGGHPTPSEGSLAAGSSVAELLAQASDPKDLVLALISGGGSALLELPCRGLSLEDLRSTNAALLKCGATIHEINTIRPHLSQVKGGGLVRLAYPARVISLILSDVVGNPLEIIASGPTVLSNAMRQDALNIVEKYALGATLPRNVLDRLAAKAERETYTDNLQMVENRLIASNRQACEAAVDAARTLGFDATYIADDWQGEARSVGERFARLVLSAEGRKCFVVGGESTVTVRGGGIGGRNQEAALGAALSIAGQRDIVVATFATDGVDGPTDAAGAIVTGDTIPRARSLGLNPEKYLAENNSYSFFEALRDLIVTGPTGTNVNDLMFGLTYR